MKKRILSLLLTATWVVAAMAQSQVKYVFYFIGDGMGVNQINVTETYLAALKGRIGTEPILMASLPVVGLVNTYSATNGVTDSAAGGTALASGKKTKNGAIGMLEDLQTPCTSIAAWAKNAGKAVGVATTVAITHATPASFFGHQPNRNMYYELGQDLCQSGFDFFAGADFHPPFKKEGEPSLHEQARAAGYTILKGYKEYEKKGRKADKLILLQSDKQNEKLGSEQLPYALDQTKDDLTLEQITRAGINYLMSKNTDGFFFQIEGGMIDWACHRNDIGSCIAEVLDMDKAVKVASSMRRRARPRLTEPPKWQKEPKKFNWASVEKTLQQRMGFGAGITLKDKQQDRLKERWADIEKAIAENGKVNDRIDDLCETTKRILSEVAMISWASGGHSNGYVPIFAVGPGTEVFQGRIDNIEIAPAMARIAGYAAE